MTKRILFTLLTIAVFISALSLVLVRYDTRMRFIELQQLRKKYDALEVEWGRLQLEESAWTRPGRIEKIASTQLDMRLPPPDSIIMIKVPDSQGNPQQTPD